MTVEKKKKDKKNLTWDIRRAFCEDKLCIAAFSSESLTHFLPLRAAIFAYARARLTSG
jgi:hypothetical protein